MPSVCPVGPWNIIVGCWKSRVSCSTFHASDYDFLRAQWTNSGCKVMLWHLDDFYFILRNFISLDMWHVWTGFTSIVDEFNFHTSFRKYLMDGLWISWIPRTKLMFFWARACNTKVLYLFISYFATKCQVGYLDINRALINLLGNKLHQ